ncbi:MAG: hypothetical protein LBS19_06960 [Clostridiales bacterium]|nr:hypothetical protein [Clostridiales bacterium]
MADKTVIYCKQSGGPLIPLTVRIEWLSDGTINPLMFWTPDGTCYEVIGHSTGVKIAFLKERGVGLRWKVRGEIIETPDPETDELLHMQHETYLYLADKRFSERNIIDERYGHTGKEYIPVTLDVFPDGDYELIYFWAHGSRYMVEKTADVDNRGSFKAGGVGIWHKVEARLINADNDDDPNPLVSVRRTAAVYLELNKWFVRIAETA